MTGLPLFRYLGTGGRKLTTLNSDSPEETERIGLRIGVLVSNAIAARPSRGGVVSLEGPLGAGKTVLVKGMARALGIDEPITSPTFTLISHYRGSRRSGPGRLPIELVHVDLYRVDGDDEIEELGLEDLMGPGALVVIEWGEKAESFLPEDAVRVGVKISPDGRRRLEVRGLPL